MESTHSSSLPRPYLCAPDLPRNFDTPPLRDFVDQEEYNELRMLLSREGDGPNWKEIPQLSERFVYWGIPIPANQTIAGGEVT